MTLRGLLCVAGKELREWLSERDSRRGFVVQSGILILMLGVFVPWTTPGICWTSPGEVVTLYVVFPALISSMLAADAFAGEKERKTLESLLATPLTDFELFLGKTIAAVGLSTAASIATVLISAATVSLRTSPHTNTAPAASQCASVILGSFGVSLAIAALAVAVSSRVTVARSAQQLVQVIFLLFSGVSAFALERFHGALNWHWVTLLSPTLVAIGLALLSLASTLFSRERLVARL